MASARQIRDEIMKMTIVVNSDPAQKAIYDLSKKNQDLKDRNDALKDSLEKTKGTLGKNSDEYKKLTAELQQNKQAIFNNETQMEKLRGEMGVTQMTMQQLRKEAALLKANLSQMVPGSEQYVAMQKHLDEINTRMGVVRRSANESGSSFGNLANKFNQYQGLVVAATAVIVGFGASVQNIIDRNNKLVDAQTAVAKTVNMTKQEVDELTKSFSSFDTRTSRIDLLKIAETGGRLGVGKAEIKDFVQEVDKANVALGDGFAGGVEAVTDTLGKLKNLYGETKDLNMAAAINEIGSAMNELGANGAATEQNIGEFALRLGSLPAKLKPTIAESLALGAAFEESGINAERSATAYSTFVRNAATNAEKFAKMMGISKKEVEDLMNTDPLEFFLKFSEGMKGMDTTKLAQTMEYLKMNDQYVIAAMGSASENTDRFRASIALSNKSLTEATSLTNEFNKVNNNTAAIFEKVQKRALALFTSESIANTLNFLISAFGKFIGAVEDADGTITGFRNVLMFLVKTITLVMVTMVSYNLLTGVYNALLKSAMKSVIELTLVEKARNLVTSTANVIAATYRGTLWLLAAGYSFLKKDTVGATFAMQGFNTVIKANPIGLFISLLIATVTAIELFSKETNVAANAQKNLNQVAREGVKNAAEEIGKLDQLYKAATNAALGKDAQRKAAEELIKLWPQQFKAGSEELIMNGKLEKSYNEVRQAIMAASRAKAAQAEIDKLNAEYLSREEEIKQKMLEAAYNSKHAGSSQTVNAVSTGAVVDTRTASDNREIAKNQFRAQTESLKNLYIERNRKLDPYIKYVGDQNVVAAKIKPGNTPETNSNYNVPGTDITGKKGKGSTNNSSREEDKYQKLMDDIKAKYDKSKLDLVQMQLDLDDAVISAMDDGYEKEMLQLKLQEDRKLAAIEKQKHTEFEFKKLDELSKKAKGDDKKLFEAVKLNWIKENEGLELVKQQEIIKFAHQREILFYKNDIKEINKKDEIYQTELNKLKVAQNDELASYKTLADLKNGLRDRLSAEEISKITTWSEGKQALAKTYNKKELELSLTHLQEMQELFKSELDLGYLTPDQRKEVLKFLEDVGIKISETKAKIAGDGQTDPKVSSLANLGGQKADILGFTAENWNDMFKKTDDFATNLGKVQMAVQAIQNAFAMYYQFVDANEKRQLQAVEANNTRKKNSFKKQLDAGYINQETYKKLTLEADQELDKKKAEMELRAAKRNKQMAISQVITSTALGIMNIWATQGINPIMAGILTGVVGALGLLQLGTIMAQPLPTAQGFEEGLYPMKREQDGRNFNVRRRRLSSGLVDRPTHFIAGENNRVEMVIDNPTWTSYPAELKRAIYSANSRAKGFEGGFNTQSSGNDDVMIMVMQTLAKTNATLENIQRYGIMAKIEKNARNGKDVIEMGQEYLDLNNKNKH